MILHVFLFLMPPLFAPDVFTMPTVAEEQRQRCHCRRDVYSRKAARQTMAIFMSAYRHITGTTRQIMPRTIPP